MAITGRGTRKISARICTWAIVAFAAVAALAASTGLSHAAPETPVAGKQVRWEQGLWAAVPQVRDGKVSQCVLVARRSRAGRNGEVATNLTLNIGRGAGFAIAVRDANLALGNVLDDQAEIILDDGRPFPAVSFDVTSTALAFHPGDAAAVLAGLEKAVMVRLRSAGAGVDSGAVALNLPREALEWLKQCGKIFNIAIDRPTAPNAPALPTPRARAAEAAVASPAAAGPADKQTIDGWDASVLHERDGSVGLCMVQRQYVTGSEKDARRIETFVMVGRVKGLIMMLKDSTLDLAAGKPIEATLLAGDKPFSGFTAQAVSKKAIGIFPQHGEALARALDKGGRLDFKAATVRLEFPVQSGVVGWLRACATRHGIAIEPGAH